MRVLVTGGAGYIGSHTCVEMLQAGMEVVVVDNLSNSKEESLRRVRAITGQDLGFVQADTRDRAALDRLFATYRFDAVVHFAGCKAVGESVAKPLEYYENNVGGTITLCEAMAKAEVRNIVFSSTATVYGEPDTVPIREDFPLAALHPYGRTKLFIEHILRDQQAADPRWNVIILRYFNPVGAHPSGRIGEDPNGIPNNLMPFVTQVAVGTLPRLRVFGNDYPTPDGTGVRDYLHVVDLARGHVAALNRAASDPGLLICNLGTGRGHSVLEMVDAFERVTGRSVPHEFVDRRPGDIAEYYADPALADVELGWSAELGVDDMVRDAWRWQSQNPNGYDRG